MDRKTEVAVLTAMQKVIKEALDEKRPRLDAEMRQALEEDGVEKKAIMIEGNKVGEIGWSFSKPTLAYTDFDAFKSYLLDAGLLRQKVSIAGSPTAEEVAVLCEDYPHLFTPDYEFDIALELFTERNGEVVCTATGEVVDFVSVVGRLPKSTAVRIPDAAEVLKRVTPRTIGELLQQPQLLGAGK